MLENDKIMYCFNKQHTIFSPNQSSLLAFKCEQEPPLKKRKSVTSEPAALCVAVNGDYAAVGCHGAGIKLFSLDSGVFMFKECKKTKSYFLD